MKSLRIGLSLAVMLVVATVMGAGTEVAAAGGSVGIARYGTVVTQQRSAQCSSDETSVAIARGDGSSAEAYHNGSATANGADSEAYAYLGSTATANGTESRAYG